MSGRNVRVLVLQHGADVGPGLLGEWLRDAGAELDVRQPFSGDEVPDRVDADGLLVLGGTMAAYDDLPELDREKALLRSAVRDGVPTLGVCLGGQLLAVACGGRVERARSGPEIGAALVAKRDAAYRDPLFGDSPLLLDVVQWHYDEIVELPPGATLLAAGTSYPHQAFRVGERAWGTQFHFEAGREIVSTWAAHDKAELEARGLDPEAVVAAVLDDDLAMTWRPFADRFVALLREVGADVR
jgi:GMP synthase-like glutamine amidotransferase